MDKQTHTTFNALENPKVELEVDRTKGKARVETPEHKQHQNPVIVEDIKDIAVEPGELPPQPEPYVLTVAKLLAVLKGSSHISVDEGQVGTADEDKVVVKVDQDVVDFLFPKEIALADIEHSVTTGNTVITTSAEILDHQHSYDVTLEIEGDGSHYGAKFTVFANNGSTCLSVFYLDVEGEIKECFASMDNQGSLHINLPFEMAPESQDTIITFKRAI